MATTSPAMSGYDMRGPSATRGIPITSASTPLQSKRSNGTSNLTNGNSSTCMAPTWYGFVHTTNDALLVLEACLQGKLQHIPRRPHDRERAQIISSGNVFIYEENASGIKRWTDGVTWSPSRIMGNFLVYRELNEPFPAGEKKKAKKRKRGAEDAEPVENLNGQSEEDRKLVGSLVDSYGFKPNGLIKKTLNIKYQNVNHHIVTYYSLSDVKDGVCRRPQFDSTFNGITPRPDLVHHQFKANAYEADDIDPDPFQDPQQQPVLPPSLPGHLVRHDSPQQPVGLSHSSESLVPHLSSAPMVSSIGHQHVLQTSHISVPARYNSWQSSFQSQQPPSHQFYQGPAMSMPSYSRHDPVVPVNYYYDNNKPASLEQSPTTHLDLSSSFQYAIGNTQHNTFHANSPSTTSYNGDNLAEDSPAPAPKRRHTGPTGLMNGSTHGPGMHIGSSDNYHQEQTTIAVPFGWTFATPPSTVTC